MKLKKKILALFTCMALLCAMGMTASAASFNLLMKKPDASGNTIRYTTSMLSTSSPYVNPTVYAVPTTYFLALPNRDAYNVSTTVKEVSTPGRRSFTYYSGYGGSGQYYRMGAMPISRNYNEYRVNGSWSA